MAKRKTIEQRLSAVEVAIAELRQKIDQIPNCRPGWLKRLRGSMKGMRGFPKMVELGRQVRRADRPPDDGDEL